MKQGHESLAGTELSMNIARSLHLGRVYRMATQNFQGGQSHMGHQAPSKRLNRGSYHARELESS